MNRIKHIAVIFLLTCICLESTAQMLTEPYDSISNFVGKDVKKYSGQVLYLRGMPKLKKIGYSGFLKDFRARKTRANIFKCGYREGSDYDYMAERSFQVLAAHRHPKPEQDTKFYLELLDPSSGYGLYYEYNSLSAASFPFYVKGYIKKQQDLFTNKEFVSRGKTWQEPLLEVNTNTAYAPAVGQQWQCKEVFIEKKHFVLVCLLENAEGEQVHLPINKVLDTKYMFTADSAKVYIKRYGQASWDNLLKSEIEVGMTEEMLRLSRGEPKTLIPILDSSGKTSKWIYDDKSYYFESKKVVRIE